MTKVTTQDHCQSWNQDRKFLSPREENQYIEGTITTKAATPRSYYIECQGKTYCRTCQHIHTINVENPVSRDHQQETVPVSQDHQQNQHHRDKHVSQDHHHSHRVTVSQDHQQNQHHRDKHVSQDHHHSHRVTVSQDHQQR